MFRYLSRLPWFARSLDLNKKAKLSILRLEDRVVPSTSFADYDAVGLVGKTVSVTISHNQGSGDVAGRIDWKDGSSTEYTSWPYTTASKTFTHTYSTAGTYKIETEASGGSVDASVTLNVAADVIPAMAVDAIASMEFSANATSAGNNPSNTSSGMVRYADGVVDLHFPDLESTGYGMPFGITRSWSNGPGYDQGTDLGPGWNINQLPTITQVNGTTTLSVVIDGNEARTFDQTSTATVYQERFFGQHKLTHDTGNGLYVLSTPGGVIYKFKDFTGGDAAAFGTFDSRTDANGIVTSVYSRSSGYITEIRRGSESSTKEAWVFTYSSNKITSIAMRRGSSFTSPTTYRRVDYTYYGSEDHGNDGDLKTAKIYNGSDTIAISTQYYRYYKPNDLYGFAGALKMYIGFASYERADTALDPLTASDNNLKTYVDLAFEYDSSRRVTSQKVQGLGCSMCSAGVGTYTFSYTASSHGAPAGVNRWAMKTTETLPDGNQNIVYTNSYGQVMQSVQKDGSTYWRTHYVYDGVGKLVQKSNPSATTNVNESFPELVITNDARLGIEPDFLVNSTTTGSQIQPSVASDWQGNYAVSWIYGSNTSALSAVYVRLFNAAGQAISGDILVDTSTTNGPVVSAIAMDHDGDFVVGWHEYYSSEGDGYAIFARRYNAQGVAQGSPFQVNTYTTGNQSDPAIAMDTDGNFVIAWSSYGQDGSGQGIYAQRYDNTGSAQGGEFRINTTTANSQREPAVDMDDDGDFVVTWASSGQDGSSYGVFARRYDSTGSALAGEFQVNTTTLHSQKEPSVVTNLAGAFVIAWSGGADSTGGDYDVFIQQYNSSGATVGSEVRVNSSTAYSQYLSALACNARGDFIVSWTNSWEDGSYYGVYAKFFMADGTAGSQVKINEFTTSFQWQQAVASDYDGNFVVAWAGSTWEDASGIYTRQLERRYSYVADTTGLVERFQYARKTSATNSSATTSTGAGDISGLLSSTWITQGDIGVGNPSMIQQSAFTYYLHSDGTNTVSPLATSTVYRATDGTGGQTTTMDYTFVSSSLQIASVTVTHPTVTTAQNGPNSAAKEYALFDSYGRRTYSINADSYLTYRAFDDATGAVTVEVADVDTDSPSPASSGTITALDTDVTWWVPNTSGLHLTTDMSVDFLGRVTLLNDPNDNDTYYFYNDPGHEIRVYPGWFESTKSTTGPTQVYREDWARSYTETLTMTETPNTSDSIPLGTESIGSVKSLSRVQLNDAGQKIYFDDYWKLSDVTYSASSAILKSGGSATRHYRSEVQYAARGGIKKEVTPNGTITRYERDALNRVASVWIGTDDTSSSGVWPSVTTGTDMVKVYTYVYDLGGVGDGNLTSVTADPGAAADRVTEYYFDWRNRPVAVKMGAHGGSESLTLTTNRPIYTFIYDNLDQITSTKQYDGDNVTITVSGDSITLSGGPSVQSRMDTAYDEMGRAYRETIFSGSSTTTFLTTDTWYDKRGNIIKILEPGGLVTKPVYDGVGRTKSIFFTDGGSDPSPGAASNWDHADDRASDLVYEELHYTFDKNGNITQTTRRERQPTASGTGDLADHDTQPYARVSYTGNYHDAANRLTATVDVGTYGDTPWTVSISPPSGSDTALLTTFAYDSAGDVTMTTDPRGIQTRNTYDAMHRLTQMIEGYDDGTPSGTNDRKTNLEYDGSSHVTKRTLWLDAYEYEETQYVYGVDAGVDGNELTSNDLLGIVLYPDPEDGYPVSPFPAQYQYSYNRLGEIIRMEDINDTVHEYEFDVVGRLLVDNVTTLGSGIDDAVSVVTTEYDSAGRAFRFSNWTALGYLTQDGPSTQIVQEFNGYGQITKEYQEFEGKVDGSTLYVGYNYTSSGNRSVLESINYPTNDGLDPEISFTLDAIGRVSEMSADYLANPLETVTYLGLSRIIGRDVGDGTLTETVTLDTFGREMELEWENDSPATVEHFRYGYDRNGNVLYRTNELDHNFDELYQADASGGYDNLNQMTRYARGVLTNSGGGAGLTHVLTPTLEKEFARDAVGNVTSVTTEGSPLIREFDRQNRLTDHGSDTLGFDAVGNLTTDDQANTYTYDAWNRLVGFNAESDRYAYDAMGRRTKVGDRRLYHAMDGSVIEEHDGGGLKYQHVHSLKGKQHALARFDYSEETVVAMFAITDIYGTVTSITDVSGVVLERYVYDPQGQIEFYSDAWERITVGEEDPEFSMTGNYEWTATLGGGRWDSESELFEFESQIFNPRLQIWTVPSTITLLPQLTVYDSLDLMDQNAQAVLMGTSLKGCLQNAGIFKECMDAGLFTIRDVVKHIGDRQRDVVKFLEKMGGLVVKGGKGSHVKVLMPNGVTHTIPEPVGIGLLTSIVKEVLGAIR